MENNQLKKFSGEESLPAAAVNADTEQYCAICLNGICGGDTYRKLLECGHGFHCTCIDAWLGSHSTCPLCRAQIISLKQNHYDWGDFVELVQDFLRRMCNPPLNQELSSMLCGNISCIS